MVMSTLTVRQLDDETYEGFKQIAQKSGRSMEAEVRTMIEERVHSQGWWLKWIEATKDLRGDPLPIPPRSMPREPPDFS